MRSPLPQRFATLLLMVFFMKITGDSAWAQSVLSNQVPQNVQPGALDNSLQKSFDTNKPKVEENKAPSEVNVAPPTEAQEKPKLPVFRLEEIQVRNATILTREDMAPIITPIVGQDVTEDDLLKATHAITDIYHQKGYLTSRAFLPSQKVENGVIVILAQENRLGDIQVQGAHHVTPEWILKQITAKKGELFNVKKLEAELNKIQKDPKIVGLRADIRPGKEPLTNDMTLVVKDTGTLHMVNTIDNTGRETVGQIHYNASLFENDFLGLGHQVVLSYTGASGLQSAIAQYAIPLNDWGWTVGTRASLGDTTIGGHFDFADITGRSQLYSAYTSIPLIKKEKLSVTGDLSYNAKFSNLYFSDARQDALEQNVQSISSGINFLALDKLGHWSGDGHGDIAINNNETHFYKLYGDLSRLINLPLGMVLLLRSQGQYSPYNLPGLEQFQIGGSSTIRGYSEGFLIADSGYVLGSELHLPFWGAPDVIKKNMEWLLFAESGSVYLSEKEDPSTKGSPGNLVSYGVGLRGRLTKYISGRLDVGFAQRTDTDLPTGRIHFGLTGYPF